MLRSNVVFGCSLAGYAGPFAGGTGDPGDPYQIATAEQLISIGSDPNLSVSASFSRTTSTWTRICPAGGSSTVQ
jgi:hypothetical protein